MKVYQVGGSLRDEMLGLAVQDRDWVVVGADPAEMARRGFRPVGADFPVFLHPETHEEYALARTERKTGPGYRGFAFHAAPDVTLEQDLERRDLTINAMARGEDGVLVDPHGGAKDLRAGVLRHVSPAFAEDPVRILRVARFAARFGFAVAPETMALMRRMVDAGEADALVPERVWQELSRGLLEKSPSRMIAVLRECGALARVLPEVDRVFDRPEEPERLAARLEHAATRGYGLAVRYALLVIDLDPADAQALARRVNAPNDCRELATLAARERSLAEARSLDAESTLGLLERADAFRRPERLDRLIETVECDALAPSPEAFVPRRVLEQALEAARNVDGGAVAREFPDDIPGAIRRARLTAIAALQPPTGH
jgi:tRNA nucleotidyltransferase (CCA-adding enzyme)